MLDFLEARRLPSAGDPGHPPLPPRTSRRPSSATRIEVAARLRQVAAGRESRRVPRGRARLPKGGSRSVRGATSRPALLTLAIPCCFVCASGLGSGCMAAMHCKPGLMPHIKGQSRFVGFRTRSGCRPPTRASFTRTLRLLENRLRVWPKADQHRLDGSAPYMKRTGSSHTPFQASPRPR